MTRPAPAALFLSMLIAGGCAATADDIGSSEDPVHLGHPPDAGTEADAAAGAAPDPDIDAGPDIDAASNEPEPALPPGPSTTAFADKLTAIGLDVNDLPSLHDLPMAQKLKVMRTFNESMGISCNACHDTSDYAKPTEQKEIAAAGWEGISRKLTMGDGSAIYCDSCHYGKFDFLDRSEGHEGIARWMQKNFVEQLKTKSGEEMQCTTCHVNGPPGSESTH